MTKYCWNFVYIFRFLQDFEIFQKIESSEYIYDLWKFEDKLRNSLLKFSKVSLNVSQVQLLWEVKEPTGPIPTGPTNAFNLFDPYKSGDFSLFHSIVYVHPPPTYSLRASASFTDRL